MYYLYLLRCADGTLYAGITTDLERRVAEHNSSPRAARYTRSRRPVKLVYSKVFENKSAASQAEHQIRQLSRQQKLALIQSG